MPVLYHQIDPESNRATFSAFNTVSFVINTDRNVVRNSIRIEGELRVNSTGANPGTRAIFTDRLHMNRSVGVHSLIESVTTSSGNGVVLENISQDYARYVAMKQAATKTPEEYYDSAELCELKAPTTAVAIAYACGEADDTSAAQVFADADFSFKPMICLNRASGDIPMSKLNNSIRISFNLARQQNVLAGLTQVDACNYVLSKLRLTYRSIEPSPMDSVMMKSVVPIKQIVSSSNSSVNTRVPAVVDSVAISFLQQSRENANVFDTLALERPPAVDEVSFLFNDATNKLQQYVLSEQTELLSGFLDALKSAGMSSVSPGTVKGNSAYGLGLDFAGEVDLTNQKFGFNIRSGCTTANQYIAYLFFNSNIEL